MSDGAPWWVTALIGLATLVTGNLIPPLIGGRNDRLTTIVKGAEELRDDIMNYAAQVKAEAEIIKQENSRLHAWLHQQSVSFARYQGFVLRTAVTAQIENDQKNHGAVAKRLDEIIGATKELSATPAYWNTEGRES